MNFRSLFFLTCSVAVLFLTAAKPTHQLQSVDAPPEGLPPAIAKTIQTKGVSLIGPKGKLCQVWLVKSIDLQPKFQPSLIVKYPFKMGQLIGVMQVEKKTRYKDFRGQRVRSGLYTLRYGQQPDDGNHIGTSDLADYILAIPTKYDTDPKPIAVSKKLHAKSAKTTRGTHPAIFSLLNVEKPAEQSSLEHDEENSLWILNVNVEGKDQQKKITVPIRLVLVGVTEAE